MSTNIWKINFDLTFLYVSKAGKQSFTNLVKDWSSGTSVVTPQNGSTSTCNQKWQETQIIQFRNIFNGTYKIWVHTYSDTGNMVTWSGWQSGLFWPLPQNVDLICEQHWGHQAPTVLQGYCVTATLWAPYIIYDQDKPGYDIAPY